MRITKKICLLFVSGLFVAQLSHAQQDPLYSQYMFNLLAINPSYAGINNNLNVGVTSRFQWSGLEGGPQTNTLTANTSIVGGKVGLGLMVLSDRLGVNTNTEANLSYSYKIESGTNIFSFGLQTGIINYSFDFDDLTFNPLYQDSDQNFLPKSQNASRVNFGWGATFTNDKLFVSLSIPRLLNSEFKDGVVSSTRYERHYYMTGAFIIELQRGIKIKPMALVKYVDGAPISVDLNGSVLINNNIWVGAFTRNFETYGLQAQFEISDAYRVGYSFETLGNNLTGSQLTTHEIMVSLDFAVFSHHDIFQRYF